MYVKVRWWNASLALWILVKVTTRFIKFLHFLNITFAKLPGGKSTGHGEFNIFYISPLKSLNLALVPGAKLDAHRGTWTECTASIFYLALCFYNSNELNIDKKKDKSSHSQMFFERGVLKNFAIFTGKHTCCPGLQLY